MPLSAGTRLGSYEVTAAIGAGGMGEVYRARDTKLNRDVAIKVLPDLFALDPDRLARFTREAHVLASLNHSNIAAIYGIEDPSTSSGQVALVMELVEGEDLSAVIARGPIGLADALPIARQIADALEAAHEQGIVHRDLKPANIKVRADGTVKVLDFGLAKATDAAATSSVEAMNSPTLTVRATQMGVILGTAAYMAPEQAKGKAVDRRADIWAFGVLLYEMLTGQRAFKGDDISDTLAAVLRDTPAFSALPPATPARLRDLLRRCLQKDPRARQRDIGDVRLELEAIAAGAADSEGAGLPAATVRIARRARLAMIVAGFFSMMAMVLAGAAYFRSASAATPGRAVRFAFVPPETIVAEDQGFDAVVVSPDGQKLVFTGRAAGGMRQLWVRQLDSMDAQPLPDTAGAIEPFWSPDSRSIAFAAQGKLKRIDLAGGTAQELGDAGRLNNGASWGRAGVMLVSPDYGKGLSFVQADGKVPMRQIRRAGVSPCFLPDGRHFIYNRGLPATPGPAIVGSIDSSDEVEIPGVEGRTLFVSASPGSASGWLLFTRNGVLQAQPFDADRLQASGDAVPVSSGSASTVVGGPRAGLSASDTSVLVVQHSPARDYQLAWFDRAGRRVGTVGPVTKAIVATLPSLSPDEKFVLMQRRDASLNQDIWVSDLGRGTFDRVTTDPAQEQIPVWSVDGQRVFFSAPRAGGAGIREASVRGGDEHLVFQGPGFPKDASPDGRWLLFAQRGQQTRLDLWLLPLAGDRTPMPLLNSQFDEGMAQFSQDGRWIAYTSDVNGIVEVYVRRFTDGKVGEAVRISNGGGSRPRWRGDGAELFYTVSPQDGPTVQMTAVAVKTGGERFEFGPPASLFTARMLPHGGVYTDYDVTRDGQRFLVGTPMDGAAPPLATIILNWTAELKK
jgi:Tol biopolymer transport system component